MAFSFRLDFLLVCAYDVTDVFAVVFDILSFALRRPSLVAIPVGAMLFRRIATFFREVTCQVRWMASAECSRHGMTSCTARNRRDMSQIIRAVLLVQRYRQAMGASCFDPLLDATLAGRACLLKSQSRPAIASQRGGLKTWVGPR
jgi:hypothetical protein